MKIVKDTVVTLRYKVAEASGRLIEESKEPMVYLHGGYNNTLPGIEQALIFGSWAARYLGEPGAEPGDVDVLVIGQPQRRSVTRVTTALTERLGREVSATIVSPERWKAGADGFLRQVKRGPVVQLDLGRAET